MPGGVGSAPAGYGTTLAVTLGSGQVAIRDLVFDVSGQSPLSGDTGPYYLFRAEPLTFTIASGTLDYRLQSSLFGTRSGSRSLVGLPVDVSGSGNLYAYPATNVGLVQMLTLNLDLSVTLSLEADQDTHLTFDGTVLTDFATTVPDPATVPSLLLAAMAVVTRRPRRKPS